jgi:hypothetical protein
MAFLLMPLKSPASIVNTTITLGGTSQVVQTARAGRTVITIQNTSDTTMWLNFGAVAATDVGISIAAGATWTSPPNFCPVNSINIICTTTGKKFSYLIV